MKDIDMEDIDKLINEVESMNPAHYFDNNLFMDVHDAMLSMGTFSNPNPEFEHLYKDMEWNEWQLQKAKLASLAVLNWLKNRDRYPEEMK